jgi:hypothetical protein
MKERRKTMFVTFETETTFITINISKVDTFDTETLVRVAANQLGVDYLDFFKPGAVARTKISNVDWQPLVNKYRRENVIMKRSPRKFAFVM